MTEQSAQQVFNSFDQQRDPLFETLRSQRNLALTKIQFQQKESSILQDEISRVTALNRDLESRCQGLKNKVHFFEANGSNLLDLQNRAQYLKHLLEESNRRNRELSLRHDGIQGKLTKDLLCMESTLHSTQHELHSTQHELHSTQHELYSVKRELQELQELQNAQLELVKKHEKIEKTEKIDEDNEDALDGLDILADVIVDAGPVSDKFLIRSNAFIGTTHFVNDDDISNASNKRERPEQELAQDSFIHQVKVITQPVITQPQPPQFVKTHHQKLQKLQKLCQLKSNPSIGCQKHLLDTEFNKGQSICRNCANKRRKTRRHR
jgi:hypothetical protein